MGCFLLAGVQTPGMAPGSVRIPQGSPEADAGGAFSHDIFYHDPYIPPNSRRSDPMPLAKSRRPAHRRVPTARPSRVKGDMRRLLDMLCALHGSIHRGARDAGSLVRCAVQAQPDLGLPDKALPAMIRRDGDAPPHRDRMETSGPCPGRGTRRAGGAWRLP